MGYYSYGLRGDYYRGDPGFLSTLGGIIKTVGGAIPGVGGLISAGGSLIEKAGAPKIATAATSAVKAITPSGFYKGASQVVAKGTAIVKAHPVLTAAGAAGVAGIAAGAGGTALAAHLRASRGGGRRRRMRVTNPKALRRAIRRTQGFAKLAMRTIHLVHPKRKVRFGGFKKRTRKR